MKAYPLFFRFANVGGSPCDGHCLFKAFSNSNQWQIYRKRYEAFADSTRFGVLRLSYPSPSPKSNRPVYSFQVKIPIYFIFLFFCFSIDVWYPYWSPIISGFALCRTPFGGSAPYQGFLHTQARIRDL